MTPSVGLATYRWNNNIKSLIILAVYPVLVAATAWAVVFVYHYMTAGTFQPDGGTLSAHYAQDIIYDWWPAILAGVGIWFAIAYFAQTGLIRKMSHSHRVTRREEPDLYNIVENLCISRGIKTPRIEIIETHARNAFASGIDQRTYCITVTRGLMQSLTRDELEAVMAHELTHIMRRDVRLLIVTIIFVGMFGFLAQMAWFAFRTNMRAAPVRDRRRNGGSGALLLLAVTAILYLGYFATLWTRFALSRRREYDADAGAVELTKKPEAMINALRRIAGREEIPQTSADIALMCIENRKAFLGMFATHPPIEDRIRMIAAYSGLNARDYMTSLPPANQEAAFGRQYKTSIDNNPWMTGANMRRRRGNPWAN